jgi:hypothetical protein
MSESPELCITHGREIKTMTFRGTGFCSIECKKEAGADVSSVGTIMFVTLDERDKIMKARDKKAQPKRPTPRITKNTSSPNFQQGSEAGCYG